jgi:hypothetical protein
MKTNLSVMRAMACGLSVMAALFSAGCAKQAPDSPPEPKPPGTAARLRRIKLDMLFYDNLPLREVARNLADEARKRDPESPPLQFILRTEKLPVGERRVDPATGQVFVGDHTSDPAPIAVRINPTVRDVTMEEALEIIVRCAVEPLSYSIESNAVVFTAKPRAVPPANARAAQTQPNPRRQAIVDKLRRTRLPMLYVDNVPLSEAIRGLAEEARKQEPAREGLNFVLASMDESLLDGPLVDPATGMDLPFPGVEYLGRITVRVAPTVRNVTLEEALEILCRCAEQPIKYSIESYGVVFAPGKVNRLAEPPDGPPAKPKLPPSPKQQALLDALRRIQLDTLFCDNLPLGEVSKHLAEEAAKRDPQREGLNLLIVRTADLAEGPVVDPATGLSVPIELIDPTTVTIRVSPALKNVTLEEALDIICRCAQQPIEYSVENYAVVLAAKPRDRLGAPPAKPDLPPNPKQQAVLETLRRIKLDRLCYDNLPLGEVVKHLAEEAAKRDAKREGINLLIAGTADAGVGPAVDPATGMVIPFEPPEIMASPVRVTPPLRNVTLEEALQVVCMCAEAPIDYAVETFGVVIAPQTTRAFHLPTARPNRQPSPKQQAMLDTLRTIQLGLLFYDKLPLSQVIKHLAEEAKKRDARGEGVNFLMVKKGYAGADPATGMPLEPLDPGTITIRLTHPANSVTLGEALEAICKSAQPPLEYAVEDYGVVLTPK